MSIDDWRYSDQKMKVREQALTVLLSRYGGEMKEGQPKYSSQSIYECVQDWVSQGNMNTAGIVKYYELIMQKVINVLAVLSFVGTAGIIGGGTVVYLRRDAIAERVKDTVANAAVELFQKHSQVC